jgi:hypothetical protein
MTAVLPTFIAEVIKILNLYFNMDQDSVHNMIIKKTPTNSIKLMHVAPPYSQ